MCEYGYSVTKDMDKKIIAEVELISIERRKRLRELVRIPGDGGMPPYENDYRRLVGEK